GTEGAEDKLFAERASIHFDLVAYELYSLQRLSRPSLRMSRQRLARTPALNPNLEFHKRSIRDRNTSLWPSQAGTQETIE
ncbi:MAG: hypothetical protein ACREC1_02760, partial [Methylovirgula sp.]